MKIRSSYIVKNVISYLVYVKDYIMGILYTHKFKSIKSFTIFIGYGRSGHTLISSIIDAHENSVISHELDVINLFNKKVSRNQLLYMILKNSRKFNKLGREASGYIYKIENQHHGKYTILLNIGDKKSMVTTKILAENLELLSKFEEYLKIPLKIIYIIRNPFDVIATRARRGNRIKRPVNDDMLEENFQIHFDRLNTIAKLREIYKRTIHEIRIENFINEPKKHIVELFNFLELTISEEFLNDCRNLIFKEPHYSRFEVNWSEKLIRKVEKKIKEFDFLSGYSYS